MRRQPEKAEQAAIVELLLLIGAAVYVLGTRRRSGDYQGTMQTPGIPDLVAFLPDKRVWSRPQVWTQAWIEVKAPKGRLSADQQAFKMQCGWANQAHLVGGIDVVTAYLERGGWLKSQQREARR